MSDRLPMYPLDAVVFPGARRSVRVTDDRYRALVHHLLRRSDPTERLLGTVAIREGYELGEHGAQSLFRVGVRLQLTAARERPDGSFDIEVLGRDRLQLDRLLTTGDFPVGEVTPLPEQQSVVHPEVVERARATYLAYRVVVADIVAGRGGLLSEEFEPEFTEDDDLYEPGAGAEPGAFAVLDDAGHDSLPRDPDYLAWAIAAGTALPLGERQQLLEATDAQERLALATDLVRGELVAMNVIASLPATEVARTRWSPN